VSVADKGVSSEATMRTVNLAKVTWISRMSETSTDAKAVLAESDETWQTSEDGTMHGVSQIMRLPQGNERWVIVSTSASPQRAQARLQRLVKGAQAEWVKTWWHLGHRRFACETDA
jgi:transposase